MVTIAPVLTPTLQTEDDNWRPLTREQAQALRAVDPAVSPWWVVGLQAAVGLVVVVLASLWGGVQAASAGWGVAAAVLPNALMARGLTGRVAAGSPGAAVVGFLVWEAAKVALTVAVLGLAARLQPGLSWPALLMAFAIVLKAHGLGLAFRRSSRSRMSGPSAR